MSVDKIVNKVEKHFNFLYQKEFVISDAEDAPQSNGSWFVEFKSPDCIISVIRDRSDIYITVSPAKRVSARNITTLEQIINFLTNGKVVVEDFKGNIAWSWREKERLEGLSKLLKQYIDEIISHYKNNQP